MLLLWGMQCAWSNQVDASHGELDGVTFVELQAGVQSVPSNVPLSKVTAPAGAISIGRYFMPAIGARVHVSGITAKGGFESINQYYSWKYITTDIDFLFNLTNFITKKSDALLNTIVLGGVGFVRSWDNDELQEIRHNYSGIDADLAWKGSRIGRNLRLGLRLESDLTKPFGASLEFTANNLDDRFNSKGKRNKDDCMLTAMLGCSYRFGQKYKKAPSAAEEFVPIPSVDTIASEPVSPETIAKDTVSEPQEQVKPEPKVITKEVEKKIQAKVHEVHFYEYREVDNEMEPAQMQRIADFLSKHPDAKVVVTGYADAGTGKPHVNARYARRRAEIFANKLIKMYGVDAKRVVIDSKGDTVQPFAENDKNRCVIIEGSAEEIIKETITIEE